MSAHMTDDRPPYEAPGALQRKWAAAWLGVSADTFDKHIRPHLGCVYVGGVRLWPITELQRWLNDRTTGMP